MKKLVVTLNKIDEISQYLGSILKYDKDNCDIKIFVEDRRLNKIYNIQNIINSLFNNVTLVSIKYESLSSLLAVYQPNLILCPHKVSNCDNEASICRKIMQSLKSYTLLNNNLKVLMHCKEDLNSNANIYIDTSNFIIDKGELLELMDIEYDKEKEIISNSLNGSKCSKEYAEAFEELVIDYSSRINDIYFKHHNNYYKIVCYNRVNIASLIGFNEFLKDNIRNNPNEIIGDFYKAFNRKQNESTNKRCIFVLKTIDDSIIGTRTIEDAKNSLELEDFVKRDLDIIEISDKSEQLTKITGDLLLSKKFRNQGLGKKLIELTNEIAFFYDWNLYGSTCWDDTKAIYESIGIDIISEVDKSIKYQWIDKNNLKSKAMNE